MQATNPRRQLGQHAYRAIVVGIPPKPLFEQRLGLVELLCDQRMPGAKQGGVRSRGLDRPLLEFCRIFRLSACAQRKAKESKGRG